jgi:N-acetylmuramic acid 6-phosphate etherase
MEKIIKLPPKGTTEDIDPRYVNIAAIPPLRSLMIQWESQVEAVMAIRKCLPAMNTCIQPTVRALSHADGRLIGAGAGTSGRLVIQDFTELTPTFGWPSERRIGLMAGGKKAVFKSVEGAEDNKRAGNMRMKALLPGKHDVVIGLAASGRTPFTIGAIEAARDAGAVTIAIANNAGSKLLQAAEFPILIETGAEVISGSTRLKAGTVQKVALNMLSNQFMIGLGKVFEGRMVDMQATNEKLVKRASKMVQDLTGCNETRAKEMLAETDGWIKPTVLMGRFNLSAEGAVEMLGRYSGNLHQCVAALTPANM